MVERIRFFGTSNANPHPDRRQSGVLLDVDGSHYLFDCGDGVASALWNDPEVCLNSLHAAFFTHRHPDHVGGLPALLLLLHQRIKRSTVVQPGASTGRELPSLAAGASEFAAFIPGEQEQADLFSELADIMHVSNAETAYTKRFYPFMGAGPVYRDKHVEVSSFPTHHVIDSSGFSVLVGEKRIVVSGDIHHPDIVAGVIGKNHCDVVIIEDAHFPTSEIAISLAGMDIGTLVVTHRRDDVLEDPGGAMLELEPLAGTCEVLLADDGLALVL